MYILYDRKGDSMKIIQCFRKLRISAVYAFCMFSLFLFVYDHYYYDITDTKYYFFSLTTCLAAGILLISTIFRRRKKKYIHCSFSLIDICIGSWLLVQIVSVILSDYQSQAFFGSAERHTGLLFSMLCVTGYLIISRGNLKTKNIINVFLGSTSLLHLLALCNFFSIDPLGFFISLSDYQSSFFIATSGNINFYASIICLSLPIACYLFITSQNSKWYLLCAISGFFGLCISNSDSGYLGIGCLLLFLIWYSCRSILYFRRSVFLVFALLSSAKILSMLSMLAPTASRPYLTLSAFLTDGSVSWILWFLCGLLLCCTVYLERWFTEHLILIRKTILISYIVLLLLVIFFFIYFSFINTTASIGFFSSYLRWNDNWGTGRANAWSHLLDAYRCFPLHQKLFGYGEDTTRLIMMNYYPTDSYLIQFDNAHNEYIQYFVTTGIIGLCAYLSIWFSSFRLLIRHHGACTACTKAVCAGIAVYLIQAVVNINQPISTPLLFLLLALLQMDLCRLKETSPPLSIQKNSEIADPV